MINQILHLRTLSIVILVLLLEYRKIVKHSNAIGTYFFEYQMEICRRLSRHHHDVQQDTKTAHKTS